MGDRLLFMSSFRPRKVLGHPRVLLGFTCLHWYLLCLDTPPLGPALCPITETYTLPGTAFPFHSEARSPQKYYFSLSLMHCLTAEAPKGREDTLLVLPDCWWEIFR